MRFAPFGALAVLLLLVVTGRVWVAVAMAVVLFGLLQARSVSPAFRRALHQYLARAAHGIAHAVGLILSWTLLTAVFVLVIVPVSALALLVRRPLGRPRGLAGDQWIPRAAMGRSGAPHRSYGADPGWAPADLLPEPAPPAGATDPAPPPASADADGAAARHRRPGRSRVPRVVTILGVLAVILLLDLVSGAVMTVAGMPPEDRGDTARDVEQAIRTTMASPVIADEPWVDEYGRSLLEFQLDGETYVPFLVRDPRSFESTSLNTTEAERRSYVPPAPQGVDPVRIAFFGGSVMFGVGQRDDHTIPSELARLAEEEGIPVEVHNYGLPGWVSWQEMQYLERLLAAGEEYDLIVFYDGFNEFLVQNTGYSVDPTHLGAATMNQFASSYHDDHETAPGPTDALVEIGSTYARYSAVGRLYDRFTGQDPVGEGELQAEATPGQKADAAIDVYERAIRIAGGLAADQDTAVRFFWQPTKAGWDPSVTDHLPDGVTDVSHALDGREDEFYIDEVHTNEAGAHLMAQALWAELSSEIRQAASPR